LKNIHRITIAKLDELFQLISTSTNSASSNQLTANTTPPATICNKLTITLNNVVSINRSGLTTLLINYLKEELNFANTEYFIKERIEFLRRLSLVAIAENEKFAYFRGKI